LKIVRQFTEREVNRIRGIRIIDVLLSVTDLSLEDIQEDPFTAVHEGNRKQKPFLLDTLKKN